MLVLLMAALVSVGGIGAACFFSRQAGKEKFQEEEAEKLKAEREYLEAGADVYKRQVEETSGEDVQARPSTVIKRIRSVCLPQ